MDAHDHIPAPAAAPLSHRHHMMMHMTFFWGKDAEILFHGWPGSGRLGMYILSLVVVFFLAAIAEWLSACQFVRREYGAKAAGIVQAVAYSVRIGLAYLVMLAVMSFNGGIFLAAIVGHGIGFYFFGRNKPTGDAGKTADFPPLNCGC